jgi:hypothetical protein
MPRLLPRDSGIERLLVDYRTDLVAIGQFAESEVISPARAFLLRVGGAEGFSRMTFEEQCQISARDTRLVRWLIASGHVQVTPEYLARSNVHIGQIAAWVHREFHAWFVATAAQLGFDRTATDLQWWAVAKVAAVVGIPPDRLTRETFDDGGKRLLEAVQKLYPGQLSPPRNLNTRLYGAEATLYHGGLIDGPLRKRMPDKSAERAEQWTVVPPRLRATLQGYVEQMRLSLRPSSMRHVERVLRDFALWLTAELPDVKAVADLHRGHIECYKHHLAERPNSRGERSVKRMLAAQLSTLRVCLERLGEWQGEDAPTRMLMFPGDVPKLDDPLPRGRAARTRAAAASDRRRDAPNGRRRGCISTRSRHHS